LCKYPPQGRRSVGLARAQGYGVNFNHYVQNANDNVAVIMQIEDIQAVNNIHDIVKVSGIDVLFIGPYDLSASMGKPGQVKDPEVVEKIETVRQTCLKAGIATGIFTADPKDVKGFVQLGYTVIAVGIDSASFAKKAAEIVKLATE
jgi:2-keto-3-deoxy-L-rhamnonate aldolase RhmA